MEQITENDDANKFTVITEVRPGDTFIAPIGSDGSACVGVVVKLLPHRKPIPAEVKRNEVPNTWAKVLVLGWFAPEPALPNDDVFASGKPHPFPTYEELPISDIMLYDFDWEIQLCRDRNATWWEGRSGRSTNLLSLYFQPQKREALMCIDIARHLLSGGSIESYQGWDHYLREQDLLLFWAVLHQHFPDRVIPVPAEWDSLKDPGSFYKIFTDEVGRLIVRTWYRFATA